MSATTAAEAGHMTPVNGSAQPDPRVAQDADGHQRPRRGDRRRPAARAADAGVRPGRLRQDAAGDGVPRPRDHRVRRARRVRGLRGVGRRPRSPTSPRSASTWPSSRPTASSCIDHVDASVHGDMEETGDWDLDGLFLRLGAAIDAVGAKRVVIDTIETLFGAFTEHGDPALRAAPAVRLAQGARRHRGHHRRARRRHADPPRHRGVRLGLRDRARPPRHRADVDPAAAHPQVPRLAARHQRVPVPDRRVRASRCCRSRRSACTTACPTERVSTGVARLDAMLGDGGFFKGSTVLVSGTAGTGKSTLAAQFCDATCGRGERAMYFAFEESEAEIIRNMSSVGIDLRQWVDAGLLQFHCFRPSLLGLEAHLFAMQKFVGEFDPRVVVMDPISDLVRIGTGADVSAHADPPGRLPEGQGRHRAVHQPELRRRAGISPTSRSPRSSTPGCWSRPWRATASTTGCCTCSSRAAWPTPTRSASSC